VVKFIETMSSNVHIQDIVPVVKVII